jgi:sulfatase maturation enzyme AslB (radical SAM superfamily)
MSLYKLIDSKVTDWAEVVVCLFDHCNLTCSFCPQEHDSLIGTTKEEILSKSKIISKWINENAKTKYFKIHLMGGEVFQDIWISKKYLDIYEELMERIQNDLSRKDEIHVVFNFITNLVFDQTDTVLEFLNKHNLKISISYDPQGRFNTRQLEVFKRNVETFKNKIEMISLVMSQQNIKAITNGDEYFDYLYSNFICDFDSFLPSVKTTIHMMPKESEVLKFNKFLIDNYPKCLNVRPFLEDEIQLKMSCTRGNSLTVLRDNTVPRGCSGAYYLTNGVNESVSKDPFSVKISLNFFEKYNCFECEYFKRCPFTCFIKEDYEKLVRDVDGCLIKKTFEYVNEKKSKTIILKPSSC